MKIAVIGYISGSNRITVSYDVVNKKFLVEEEYKDRDVRESLNRFKKSFNK